MSGWRGGIIVTLFFLAACSEPRAPKPITSEVTAAMPMWGQAATAKPIPFSVPAHPYMSAQGVNAMHGDGYSSDVHPGGGPLGIETQQRSRVGTVMPGGQCATLTFDRGGRLVALCAAVTGFNIHLLEPRTLNLLAAYELPIRPSTYEALFHLDPSKIMSDSSGAYFYLDEQDRVVMAASDQTIRRIAHHQDESGHWSFTLVDSWDLSTDVPHDCASLTNWSPQGECDPITAVLPDHDGYIWWVTRRGRIGTLDPDSGAVRGIQLDNEEIQNGFSVAADGVYVVSDHALYRFSRGVNGEPKVGWRESYDRGSGRKVGSINQGSGTTPTLLMDDYVTITDNADGRLNLLVFHRQQGFPGQRLICRVPLFERGHSATDNSMIGFNRSIILENNAGYSNAFEQEEWAHVGGGISRVDIREDDSGCDLVWTSTEHSPSVVPKLSAKNGLAYFYSFDRQPKGENSWYLMALDVETGRTQFKILTGSGSNFDNNWAPLTLAPDGTAYVGTFKGLVAIWDK